MSVHSPPLEPLAGPVRQRWFDDVLPTEIVVRVALAFVSAAYTGCKRQERASKRMARERRGARCMHYQVSQSFAGKDG